jgi:hypothetical protein
MLTLGEIVSSALQNAADGVKVASLQDASVEDRSFQNVDEYLARELNQIQEETQTKQASQQQDQAAPSHLDDAAYALKIAQALEHGVVVLEKLAVKEDGKMPTSGGGPKGGPVPLYPAPPNREGVTVPKPQASAHARHAQANRTMENGHPETDKGIPAGGGPVVPPGGFGGGSSKRLGNAKTASMSRENTLRLLRTKQAQYSALVSLGQIEAAEGVLKEARVIKAAADNMTAAADNMTSGSNGLIQGDSLSGTIMPDNEGVRNLTKAQARDASQRQAGNYFGEPVKKDNAVAATTFRTDGLKLSADKGKEDKPGYWEDHANQNSLMRAHKGLQAGARGLLGAAAGGAAAHHLSGGNKLITGLGAAAGGLGLGAAGYHGAKGEQAMRDRLRKSASLMLRQHAEKQAGLGDFAGRVGAKAIGVARQGLAKGTGLLENASGSAANSLFRKGVQGQNALGRIGEKGQKMVGGALLGGGALGTAGLAHSALKGNGQ